MNPLWDHVLVAVALTVAAGYFIRHGLRGKPKGGKGCGGDCDCGGKSVTRPPRK